MRRLQEAQSLERLCQSVGRWLKKREECYWAAAEVGFTRAES